MIAHVRQPAGAIKALDVFAVIATPTLGAILSVRVVPKEHVQTLTLGANRVMK